MDWRLRLLGIALAGGSTALAAEGCQQHCNACFDPCAGLEGQELANCIAESTAPTTSATTTHSSTGSSGGAGGSFEASGSGGAGGSGGMGGGIADAGTD